ncbi:hypothetical protein ACJOV8_018275 [Formosa sp. 3Alg 14/1]|uniref:hypothetical protein n=1 Tax=Formosa sp. 3Alg 14/1 TaxID=3382190 RepID=UPI0039BE3D35
MKEIHYLLIILFLLSGMYVLTECMSLFYFSQAITALIVPVITVFYLVTCKRKIPYFTTFLILYSVAYLFTLIDVSEIHKFLTYYVSNLMFISAYIFLIYGVSKNIPFKGVVPRFNLTIIILILLNSYVLYNLWSNDFSSEYFFRELPDTIEKLPTEDVPLLRETMMSILLEFVYNLVVLVLLNVSFINYLYKENKRSMLLFIGSLCVVFSEVIQYAIFFPSDVIILNVICFLLILVGFLCFYLFAIHSIKKGALTFKTI